MNLLNKNQWQSSVKQDNNNDTLNTTKESSNTLLALLKFQVAIRAQEVAIVSNLGEWTFQMLDNRAGAIAARLHQLGIGQDEYIGLYIEPSSELIAGVWGSLYAGCGYLPLSPEYPDKRISYMLNDSKTRVVLTQAHLKEKLSALKGENTLVLSIEEIENEQGHCAQISDNDLAYMIYTSGSTGDPKGVMVEHSSVVNQLQWLQQTYNFNAKTRILQKTPFSFDAAQWEVLANAMGACVVISEVAMYRDPFALIDMMIDKKVNVLQCVPTLLQALLDSPGIQLCQHLSYVFSGGEILTKQLATQFFDVLPEKKLINLYGPTECTINASSHQVTKQTLQQDIEAITIGKPVTNTRYYILDSEKKLVPIGQSGELFISGVQIARGYFNRQEITNERFIPNPYSNDLLHKTLYKTGDIVKQDKNGQTHFIGRVDNQIKLRGYRVELDEIRLAIEKHDWIKNAAMIIKNDQRTGFQNLIACIELNSKEAAVMDQGSHDEHHQSKKNKRQVKSQLSNAGFRTANELTKLATIQLPGNEATHAQREMVFARKTYRYFEGGKVSKQDLISLMKSAIQQHTPRELSNLSFNEFGQLMRYFGQFNSKQRLLPKYGYASPGALYATQIYIEIHQLFGLASGIYYYHPENHSLHLVTQLTPIKHPHIALHFLGKQSAISPVYQNNIAEVLEMETGHILGLFDHVLPQLGLTIADGHFDIKYQQMVAIHDDDFYMGSFNITSDDHISSPDNIEVLLQIQNVDDIEPGQYVFEAGDIRQISNKLIEKNSVIAINQQVYDKASFGISLLNHSNTSWRHYIDLGRKLQQLQMNGLNIGLMSSGYSSKSGNDLPSANHMADILAEQDKAMKPFYFCVGGKISDAQKLSEGMKEDAIHMRGPIEILKDDLQQSLPSYMVPNQIVSFNEFPLTANGKIDYIALKNSEKLSKQGNNVAYIEPRNALEKQIAKVWLKIMKWDKASVQDNFFESGGNSLTAVSLINALNKKLSLNVPMQVLFQAPTIEALALYIKQNDQDSNSRLILLNESKCPQRIFCWPGLGGYPMSLKPLAEKVVDQAQFIGIQAHGINDDEIPFETITEMAKADIKLIKALQPSGPYTLWGYSFGARVAFEVAHQLEINGDVVEDLCLIAPGSPSLPQFKQRAHVPSFNSPEFVTILFSVFFQKIQGPILEQCLNTVENKKQFIDFVCTIHRTLNREMVSKIVEIVIQTYEFKYTFNELIERQVKAPKAIFKAQGDDYSFLENVLGEGEQQVVTYQLNADHYALLKKPSVDDLYQNIFHYQQIQNKHRSLLRA